MSIFSLVREDGLQAEFLGSFRAAVHECVRYAGEDSATWNVVVDGCVVASTGLSGVTWVDAAWRLLF